MIGRSLALPVSLLIGTMLLGASPAFLTDVHAAPATAFTCTVTAPAGTLVVMPCMAPGATECVVSARRPLSVNAISTGQKVVGKAVCANIAGNVAAICSAPSSSCGEVCQSTTSCGINIPGLTIPPPFKGTEARCVAVATDASMPVTTTCTIFEK
jgi:hypothetical protein